MITSEGRFRSKVRRVVHKVSVIVEDNFLPVLWFCLTTSNSASAPCLQFNCQQSIYRV